jgi:hypothetical protein
MDNLDKDIERIKVSRMKPEERYVYKIFKNLKVNIETKQSSIIYYHVETSILFMYDKDQNIFWCNFYFFWDNIENRFNINYEDIQKLVYKYICVPLNIKKDVGIDIMYHNMKNKYYDK